MRNHHDAKRADAQNRQGSALAASVWLSDGLAAFRFHRSLALREQGQSGRLSGHGLFGLGAAASLGTNSAPRLLLADIRSHPTAVNARTRASTKAGVALLFTSDVLFATSATSDAEAPVEPSVPGRARSTSSEVDDTESRAEPNAG